MLTEVLAPDCVWEIHRTGRLLWKSHSCMATTSPAPSSSPWSKHPSTSSPLRIYLPEWSELCDISAKLCTCFCIHWNQEFGSTLNYESDFFLFLSFLCQAGFSVFFTCVCVKQNPSLTLKRSKQSSVCLRKPEEAPTETSRFLVLLLYLDCTPFLELQSRKKDFLLSKGCCSCISKYSTKSHSFPLIPPFSKFKRTQKWKRKKVFISCFSFNSEFK